MRKTLLPILLFLSTLVSAPIVASAVPNSYVAPITAPITRSQRDTTAKKDSLSLDDVKLPTKKERNEFENQVKNGKDNLVYGLNYHFGDKVGTSSNYSNLFRFGKWGVAPSCILSYRDGENKGLNYDKTLFDIATTVRRGPVSLTATIGPNGGKSSFNSASTSSRSYSYPIQNGNATGTVVEQTNTGQANRDRESRYGLGFNCTEGKGKSNTPIEWAIKTREDEQVTYQRTVSLEDYLDNTYERQGNFEIYTSTALRNQFNVNTSVDVANRSLDNSFKVGHNRIVGKISNTPIRMGVDLVFNYHKDKTDITTRLNENYSQDGNTTVRIIGNRSDTTVIPINNYGTYSTTSGLTNKIIRNENLGRLFFKFNEGNFPCGMLQMENWLNGNHDVDVAGLITGQTKNIVYSGYVGGGGGKELRTSLITLANGEGLAEKVREFDELRHVDNPNSVIYSDLQKELFKRNKEIEVLKKLNGMGLILDGKFEKGSPPYLNATIVGGNKGTYCYWGTSVNADVNVGIGRGPIQLRYLYEQNADNEGVGKEKKYTFSLIYSGNGE